MTTVISNFLIEEELLDLLAQPATDINIYAEEEEDGEDDYEEGDYEEEEQGEEGEDYEEEEEAEEE